MKAQKLNHPLTAILLALAVVVFPPNPAGAQQASCTSALTEMADYSNRNNVDALDTNNPDYRGCCLAIRVADASRDLVRICEAEGVDNAELREVRSALAGLPSSLPVSTCNQLSGGSSSCREYPALSFSSPMPDPPSSSPDPFPRLNPADFYVPPPSTDSLLDSLEDPVVIGGMVAIMVGYQFIKVYMESPEFAAHPILSFQNENGKSFTRYGTRIEYSRPDSPLSFHWSAENTRTDGTNSASAGFGGEWRGDVWTFGGEATNRDSRAALALRAGAAFTRAGWKLRLDAESAAWSNSPEWDAPEAEILLGMEKEF